MTKTHTPTENIIIASVDHPNRQMMRVFRPTGELAGIGAIACPADYDPDLITHEDTYYDNEITCYRSIECALRDVLGFDTELEEKEKQCNWLRQERRHYRTMWLKEREVK